MKNYHSILLIVFMVVLGMSVGRAEEQTRIEGNMSGRVIKLPPFLVSDTRVGGIKWHYLSYPGFEAISCVPSANAAAELFGVIVFRMEELQGTILPASLSSEQGEPTKMILLKPGMEKIMAEEMVTAMQSAALKESAEQMTSASSQDVSYEAIPQMNLYGNDSVTMLYVVDGNAESYTSTVLTEERIAALMENRSPTLPFWFTRGTEDLYRQMNQDHQWSSNRIYLPRMKWPLKTVPLLPMRAFFAGPFNHNVSAKNDFSVWSSQAEFFLRWAYDDKSHFRRDALWKFVDLSSRQPVTEELFRQCFGIGFDEMDGILNEYASRARSTTKLANASSFDIPKFRYRDATRAEIARIKADFTLKEVPYLKETCPDTLVSAYLDQAGSELLSCYNKGERDPAFLAVLARYYKASGQQAEAESILQEIAKGSALARASQ